MPADGGARVPADKSQAAFRTIGELARQTGLPQHVLRYWETRFPQLRPLQRAGNRRYYRPADVALVTRIDTLLNRDGYTIRGVQQLLARQGGDPAPATPAPPAASPATDRLPALRRIRLILTEALTNDA